MRVRNSTVRLILNKLASERKLVFHSRIFKQKILKKLDGYLENDKWPQIHDLFKNPDKYVSFGPINEITSALKKRRKLSSDDKIFIQKITAILKDAKGNYYFFDVYSNFLHMEELIEELKKEHPSETIRFTVLLWAYLSIIENSLAIIAQLFYFIAQSGENKEDKDFVELYNKYLNKGEHLLFKQLRDYAEKKDFIKKDGDTILNRPFLRNSIAHGEIFYDSSQKKFFARGREYSKREFRKEFKRVFDFHSELTHKLIGRKFDIGAKIKEGMRDMSILALKISRSGPLQDRWRVYREKQKEEGWK